MYVVPSRNSLRVGDACKGGTKENIQTAHHSSTNAIQSSEVVKKTSDFDAANATNPLFTVFRQYMRMVMEMFAFTTIIFLFPAPRVFLRVLRLEICLLVWRWCARAAQKLTSKRLLAYMSSLLSQDLCLHEMVPCCIVLARVPLCIS